MNEYDELIAKVKEATPTGWYLGEPMWIHSWGGSSWYNPPDSYSVSARFGGPVTIPAGLVAVRSIDVELYAHSKDDLVEAVRQLPNFEWLLALPFGATLSVSSHDG